MHSNFLKITPCFFLLFLFSCDSKVENPTAKKPTTPVSYDAFVAKDFTITRAIQTPGTILANELAELHPEISGRVTSILFTEGAFVKKGVLLLKLFDADLQAQLSKLAIQLKIAKAAEKRQSSLLSISGTSQQEFDNASLAVSNIKADMELMKVNISKTEVRAPFDGRIGLRQISPGAYITPVTIITNIAGVNQLKVEFAVPEAYISELMAGKLIIFKITGNPKEYTATIAATENNIANDSRNLTARALVKNADASLKPGAFADVSLNLGDNKPVLMIPTRAVIPQTRGKRVLVVKNGNAVFQNVETGYRDSSSVEIVTGILPGDTILTSGLLVIKPGQPVKVKVN